MNAVLDVVEIDKEQDVITDQAEEKDMAGARHSGIALRLGAKLLAFVEEHNLGGVYGADATFRIGKLNRLPDVSFVATARIPDEGEPVGRWEIPPDLAVEVVSPNDVYERVVGKVAEYFAAGVKQVWLITPEYKTVTVYQSPAQSIILFEDEELTSEALLPGFRCPISDLFKQPKRA